MAYKGFNVFRASFQFAYQPFTLHLHANFPQTLPPFAAAPEGTKDCETRQRLAVRQLEAASAWSCEARELSSCLKGRNRSLADRAAHAACRNRRGAWIG